MSGIYVVLELRRITAMTPRSIQQLIHALAITEGAGVTVHRTIGTPRLRHLDPFLLLDHFASRPRRGSRSSAANTRAGADRSTIRTRRFNTSTYLYRPKPLSPTAWTAAPRPFFTHSKEACRLAAPPLKPTTWRCSVRETR